MIVPASSKSKLETVLLGFVKVGKRARHRKGWEAACCVIVKLLSMLISGCCEIALQMSMLVWAHGESVMPMSMVSLGMVRVERAMPLLMLVPLLGYSLAAGVFARDSLH